MLLELQTHIVRWTIALVALGVALRILTTRRPAQSLIAWLLALVFVPLVAIPLYALFGARKFPRKVRQKTTPRLAGRPPGMLPAGGEGAQTSLVLWTEGVPGGRHGNRFELLGTGELAYSRLMELIGAARTSIDLTVFILGNDEVGWAVVRALIERARAGVKVRVLVDAIGSSRIKRQAARKLASVGAELRSFMPLFHAPIRGRTNLRSHRKFAIVDGQQVFLGGMNIALEYMGPTPRPGRWRDLAAVVSGPVAADAEQLFAADWAFAGGEPQPAGTTAPSPRPEGQAMMQFIPSGPDMRSDTFYDALLTALFAARRQVALVTPYYVPDDSVHHALVLCARRGVHTRLLVPRRSNHPLADFARRGLLTELTAAGVEVGYFPLGMVHGKAMVVDEVLAFLGSPNLDMRSFFLNYEDALFLYGREEIAELRGWIDGLWAACESDAPPQPLWFMGEIARLLAPEL
jgi:cardiolipin synthase